MDGNYPGCQVLTCRRGGRCGCNAQHERSRASEGVWTAGSSMASSRPLRNLDAPMRALSRLDLATWRSYTPGRGCSTPSILECARVRVQYCTLGKSLVIVISQVKIIIYCIAVAHGKLRLGVRAKRSSDRSPHTGRNEAAGRRYGSLVSFSLPVYLRAGAAMTLYNDSCTILSNKIAACLLYHV